MIFHTAAEEKYYNFFFKRWYTSLKKFNPNAKFSLRFIGNTDNCDVVEYCNSNNIMLDIDPITLDQIMEKYKCDKNNSLGYYAISRWISLPLQNDHVYMTDVDLLQINAIDFDIETTIENVDFITLSRQKENKTNKMMFLGFNKNFVDTVKDISIKTLDNGHLTWNLDTKILIWLIIKQNFKWKEFIRLECLDLNFNYVNPKVLFGYFSATRLSFKKEIYKAGLDAKAARYKLFADKIKVK